VCGRFALTSTPEELAQRFELEEVPELKPRYNVAPGQEVTVVRPAEAGRRQARPMRWGLVPAWCDGPGDERARNLINARAESAAAKPAFRTAFRQRRCLVPANGFYEWTPRGDFRQPYWISPPGGGLVAFAGLWESWQGDDVALESCAVLTCEAVGAIRELHPRMPVLLEPEAWREWLAPGLEPEAAEGLLRPRDPGLVHHPVGIAVNAVSVDDPSCLEPVPEPPRQMPLL